MISIIMPARNVSSYVSEAVNGLLKASFKNWELIIIEDHSTDNTLSILREMEEQDSRIRVFENKGIGKVAALNYGYTFSSGVFIKCIDADDVLSERFFDYIYMMNDCDALCHNSYVTASDLTILGSYSVDKSIAGTYENFDEAILIDIQSLWGTLDILVVGLIPGPHHGTIRVEGVEPPAPTAEPGAGVAEQPVTPNTTARSSSQQAVHRRGPSAVGGAMGRG